MLQLRPCVQEFACIMEAVLRENDHKGGWSQDSFDQLLDRLYDEAAELEELLRRPYKDGAEQRSKITKEAVDVANFAMMISNSFGFDYGDQKSPWREGDPPQPGLYWIRVDGEPRLHCLTRPANDRWWMRDAITQLRRSMPKGTEWMPLMHP